MEKKRVIIVSLVIALLPFTVIVAGCTSNTGNNTTTSTATMQTSQSAPMTKTSNATNVTRGGSINTTQGKNFTITLQTNPSTGYSWEPQFDRTALSLVDSVFISDPNPHHLVGVPGSQVFTFQGLAKGTTTITFNNVSPSQTVTDQATYTVTVN